MRAAEAIKRAPVVGSLAGAIAKRVPSPLRLRMLPADARWIASVLRQTLRTHGRREALIVTGADSTHYRSLMNLLASIEQNEPETPVSVWNLGLGCHELNALEARFPRVEVTDFPYEDFPAYFRIDEQAGQYAWKPVIIETEVERAGSRLVVWLDAGDIVDRPLSWLRRLADARGFHSTRTPGTMRDWTHSGTLAHLKVEASLLDRPNLNGAIVALDPTKPAARALVARWSECAQARECIAPEGSDRTNHRQDQAVLTVLAHQAGLAPRGASGEQRYLMGIRTHQDVE
jgi:hypothetical protein